MHEILIIGDNTFILMRTESVYVIRYYNKYVILGASYTNVKDIV